MTITINNKKKVLLFNGPPESGKDSIVKYFSNAYPAEFIHEKFASPMKNALKSFFNLTDEEFDNFDNNHKVKDHSTPRLLRKSWRLCHINFAENFMKPSFGHEVFGNLMNIRVDQLSNDDNRTLLISDNGFLDEVLPLIESERYDITLVKIYRPGFDFKNDSRNYIDLSMYNIPTVNIVNDSSIEELIAKSYNIVKPS